MMEEGERILTAYSPMVTTLDELIEFNKVDLDVWVVDHHIINDWTTPMKDVDKDLEYVDGAATGHVKQGQNARFAQNVQVKAWLVPKHPIAIRPQIQPLEVPMQFVPKPIPADRLIGPFKRHLIFNDLHIGFKRDLNDNAKLYPFHNRAVLDVILQIAEDAQVDSIDILGDALDMSDITDKFVMSPGFYFTLQPSLVELFWWLVQFAEICGDIALHEGNHDKRLPESIKKRHPYVYGLRQASNCIIDAPAVNSLVHLLRLDELGIEFIDCYPNDRQYLAPDLAVSHGLITRAKPGVTTRAKADGYLSEIQGHAHREEHSVGIRHDAKGFYEVEAWMFGCCCRTDLTVPGHTVNQNWSNGLGIVDVYPNGMWDVNPISVRDGVAVYGGKVYTARNRLDDLCLDCTGYNWGEWDGVDP